jgi:hypothetical protein
MAYVPKYQNDVFISYAHADDHAWITGLVDRLKQATRTSLGIDTKFWMDGDDLRKSRDFSLEIPDAVQSSALMILFPSPIYIRSRYCMEEECRVYKDGLAEKRIRFDTPAFRNDLFVFRCPILPIDNNKHWALFPGATDYKFHDRSRTLGQGGPEFESEFRRLADDVVELLKRMRNRSTAVFVYPLGAPPETKDAKDALVSELSAQSYRVLPDDYVDPIKDLRESAMSVFLLGEDQGATEDKVADDLIRMTGLMEAARQEIKPWIVWRSPAAAISTSPMQRGYYKRFEQIDSEHKIFLNEKITISKLKEQVLATLRPDGHALRPADGKRRIYVIFDPRSEDIANAGMIQIFFRDRYHFEFSNDRRQHSKWLTQSDGILLVWGDSGENWCSQEFEEMQRLGRTAKTRGLCVFDPKEPKKSALELIRSQARDLHVAEQFGPEFDPVRLTPFFESLQ